MRDMWKRIQIELEILSRRNSMGECIPPKDLSNVMHHQKRVLEEMKRVMIPAVLVEQQHLFPPPRAPPPPRALSAGPSSFLRQVGGGPGLALAKDSMAFSGSASSRPPYMPPVFSPQQMQQLQQQQQQRKQSAPQQPLPSSSPSPSQLLKQPQLSLSQQQQLNAMISKMSPVDITTLYQSESCPFQLEKACRSDFYYFSPCRSQATPATRWIGADCLSGTNHESSQHPTIAS